MSTDAYRRSWLDRALEFGPALLLALAPLVFVRTGGEFENIPKSALLQFGAATLFLLWLLRGRAEELARRLPELDLPVLGFLGAGLLSLIPAINRHEAWPPIYQLLAAVAIYFVLSRSVDSVRQPRLIFGAIVASCVVVCSIGISQELFGLEWVPQAAPPASTFANRNMAAHFVAICFPLAIGLATLAHRRPTRWLGGSAVVLAAVYLWMSRTHAAWVAIAVCLALAPLVLSTRLRSAMRRRRRLLTVYVLLVLLCAVAIAVPFFAAADNAGSLSLRVIFWKNTLAMAADHPLIGVGLGNFKLLYPLYHRAAAVDWTFDAEHQLVKVHNDHLQYLAETGLLGLVAWLWLFGAGALLCRRLSRSSVETADCARIAGLVLIVIFVVAAFSFPMQRAIPPIYLFAVLGILSGLSASTRQARPIGGALSPWLRWAVVGLTLLFLVASVTHSRRALLREIHYSRGVRQEALGDHAAALKSFGAAREQMPFDTDVLLRLASSHIASGNCGKALAPLEEVLGLHPHKVNAWANLGYCHQQLGSDAEALRCFDQLIELMPDSPEAHLYRAGVYFERGDHTRAIEIYKHAVVLARTKMSLPGTRSATRVSRPRVALARAYVASGDYLRAIEQYELVLAYGEGTPQLRRALEALRLRVAESAESP